jgi:predicted dehydrogenase
MFVFFMEKELSVGIIGCGIVGTNQIKAFSQIQGVKIAAVSDIVEEKAKKAAFLVNARYYSDYKIMLREEALDLVSVATPDHLHKQPVVDSIDAGVKNLICEKPLATNLEDAYEMAQVVKKRNVRFCIDFENRWLPTFRAIKIAVSEGIIGKPVYASAMLSDRMDVPLEMWGPPKASWAGSTTCADFLLSHCTDLIRWIVEKNPETVYAVSHNRRLGFTPDYFQAIMHFEDHFTSYFESSWILNRSQPTIVSSTLDIFGTDGTIYCNHVQKSTFTLPGTEIFSDDFEKLRLINSILNNQGITSQISMRMENRNLKGEPIEPIPKYSLKVFKEGHDPRKIGNTFSHMVECIRLSKNPEPDVESGLMQVKMVHAIKKSAETGRLINISDLNMVKS